MVVDGGGYKGYRGMGTDCCGKGGSSSSMQATFGGGDVYINGNSVGDLLKVGEAVQES